MTHGRAPSDGGSTEAAPLPPAPEASPSGAGTFAAPTERTREIQHRRRARKRDRLAGVTDPAAVLFDAGTLPDPAECDDTEALEGLRRSPLLLDYLASLDPATALRALTRFDVHYAPDSGQWEYVGGPWDQCVPTRREIARRIAAGHLPAGRYVVTPWHGRHAGGEITMNVSAMRAPTAERPDGSTFLQSLVLRLVGGGEAEAPTKASRDVAKRLERIEEGIERLAAVVAEHAEVIAEARKVAEAAQDEDDEDDEAERDPITRAVDIAERVVEAWDKHKAEDDERPALKNGKHRPEAESRSLHLKDAGE